MIQQPADIFVDIDAHIASGRFIRNTSTNRDDIRDFTFRDVDLSNCRNVLDLGCAYGYFTKGLAGRLHPDARLTGVDLWQGCAEHFIGACRESGYAGEFVISDKGNVLSKRFSNSSFDLVLCSYSLYFFPHALPDIVRVIRPEGFFITVTHDVPHMPELIAAIRMLLERRLGRPVGTLPLEELFDAFSGSNGLRMLCPWFGEVLEKKYVNSLKINRGHLPGLIHYLCFKWPKFIPSDIHLGEEFVRTEVAGYFTELMRRSDSVFIAKDDTVFICRYPENTQSQV